MKTRLKLLKVCRCGKMVFSTAPYLGIMEVPGLYNLALYNCDCGSTVSIKKLKQRKVAA